MQQRNDSCLHSIVAGLALAVFGLVGVLGWTGEAQAMQQVFAQAPAACVAGSQSGLAKGDGCNSSGTGGYATIRVNRGTQERRCPRSADNECTKIINPKPLPQPQ